MTSPEKTSPISTEQATLPSERIYDLVLAKGLEIDRERLERLQERADLSIQHSHEQRPGFRADGGLLVSRPRSNSNGQMVSMVDFIPKVASDGIKKNILTPQQQDMSLVGLMGIRSLQDYVLLVEAGALDRPDILRGTTHPGMAKIAERFGFRPDNSSGDTIAADFEEVAGSIFSPKMLDTEQLLARRVERNYQNVGRVASRNDARPD